jgi:hypothetical protein
MTADPVGALLTAAEAALDGNLSLPTGRATRAAALLTRTALERIVEDHVSGMAEGLRDTSGRVHFICLGTLAGEQVAGEAAWAWGVLSTACHHHAYELTPTTGEVRHLLDVVIDLRRRLGSDPGQASF